MTEPPGFRDAVHMPFVVVTCKHLLTAGEKVSLIHDNQCVKWPTGEYPIWHGVVDPFRTYVPPEEPCRVYLRKECYANMRHDFDIEVYDRGGTDTCHDVCNIFRDVILCKPS